MPVNYNGNKIIPAPFISINKEVRRTEDGTARRIDYTITARGKLVAYMGSPDSNGDFWTTSGYPPDENIVADSRLKAILAKQGALSNLFCQENKFFEVQPYDGSAPIKAIVKLRSITFDEGNWFDTCGYTIQLDVVKMWYGSEEACSGGTAGTTPAEESWTVEQADDRGKTYRIQHTVSASAKADYDETGTLVAPAWKVARDIVLSTSPNFLGLDSEIYSTPNAAVLTGMTGHNYVRGQQIDEANGKYTATESWLMYDKTATDGVACLEEYTVNIRLAEDGKTRVSIEGNLTGLETRNNTDYTIITDRWTNAQARWTLLEPQLVTIANTNAGITLNPEPLSKSLGKNPINGTISFSREYDNRPIVYPGALSAVVQVNESRPTNVFASLVVLGKIDGPILQDIGTVTARRRTIAVEIAVPSTTISSGAAKPDVESIVDAYSPGGFKERDEENWSEHTGRYSRNVAWVWV